MSYGPEWPITLFDYDLFWLTLFYSSIFFSLPVIIRFKNDSFLDRFFLNRLKSSLGITRDISDTELGQLCMRNQEEAVDYIDRAQIVNSNIIEAEKSLRGPLQMQTLPE